MELVSPNLQTKILWDKLQWLTEGTIIIVAFLSFAIEYSDYRLRRPVLFWVVLLSISTVFNLLVFTDGLHHLIYPDPHLTTDFPFPDLEYTFTSVIYVFSLYIYIATLFGIGLLARRIFQPPDLYRPQFATIAIGFFIPVLLSVFALLGIRISPQRDVLPFSLAIGNLVVAYGLFRFRLFDIVPIARDRIFENIMDPLVVVDLQDRVVDLNPAALAIIERRASEVIGQSPGRVFAAWPDLIEKFSGVNEVRTEVSAQIKGETHYFELAISPLNSQAGLPIGRVFIARDITGHKEMDQALQQLNHELENRVSERTEELAEAYEKTLEGWAKALEFRDKETEGHSRRVTETTLKLARALGLGEEELIQIHRGAILHDIGKMAIPDEILRKADALDQKEWEIVHKHPSVAYELLSPIPYLKRALEIPYCHHEKWDGSGYPRGLRGEEIPLAARIFSVADVWDAIQSDRSYNKAWPRERAIQYIRDQAGKYFDPGIVDLFLKLAEKGEV
jgi:PAS domain S-box-containing protein